jgi:hypothetical protein
MSALTNDAATLRFTLTPAGDALASAAIEFFDARDKSFWPLVQLPVLHLHTEAITALARMIAPLLEGKTDSFAWRGGHGEELALSVARGPEEGRWIVEVGIDLSAYLRETAHLFIAPKRELALFRFHTTAGRLQEFSAGLPG